MLPASSLNIRGGPALKPTAGRAPFSSKPPCGKIRVPQFRQSITLAATKKADVESETEVVEEPNDHDNIDYGSLSPAQVQTLLSTICNETDIAELKLDMGSYGLTVRRRMTPTAPPPPPAAATAVAVAAPAGGASAGGTIEDSLDDEASMSMDESLIFVVSPKVGILRRGIYNKAGKKVGTGPPAGTAVKKGQPLCSIEQLGTYVPICAPQQGEVVSFIVEDGGPVEFKEDVVEFLPYFGGHIIGDRKYA